MTTSRESTEISTEKTAQRRLQELKFRIHRELVDEIELFMAPFLIGGAAPSAVAGQGAMSS